MARTLKRSTSTARRGIAMSLPPWYLPPRPSLVPFVRNFLFFFPAVCGADSRDRTGRIDSARHERLLPLLSKRISKSSASAIHLPASNRQVRGRWSSRQQQWTPHKGNKREGEKKGVVLVGTGAGIASPATASIHHRAVWQRKNEAFRSLERQRNATRAAGGHTGKLPQARTATKQEQQGRDRREDQQTLPPTQSRVAQAAHLWFLRQMKTSAANKLLQKVAASQPATWGGLLKFERRPRVCVRLHIHGALRLALPVCCEAQTPLAPSPSHRPGEATRPMVLVCGLAGFILHRRVRRLAQRLHLGNHAARPGRRPTAACERKRKKQEGPRVWATCSCSAVLENSTRQPP